ncbi:MAG: SPFH domain-containing protein [Luteibaculaceae bacterium]
MEKEVKPKSGYLLLFVTIILLIAGIGLMAAGPKPIAFSLLLIGVFLMPGFIVVNPNESKVLVLFGDYTGTVKTNGFFWVNPFYTKKNISLRARNFDSERLKVNDKLGNPILISVILVWRVKDTFKAAFDVNDFEYFVKVQTDAAVRKLAGFYPYDNFSDTNDAEITLRSGMEEVNTTLESEISERLAIAGIQVMEARIGYLAYAEEIAQAMLKRQQATAIVAARFKIVEGAVSMVEMALNQITEKTNITLSDDKKAAMVSNLLVVLCGDKEATPIVNTGTAPPHN